MGDCPIPEGISLAGHFSKSDKDFYNTDDWLHRKQGGKQGFQSAAFGNEVEPREQVEFTPSPEYQEAMQKEAEGFAKQGLRYAPPPDMRPKPAQRQQPPIRVAQASGPVRAAVTENEDDDDLFDWTGGEPVPAAKQALFNPNGQSMPPDQGVIEEDIQSPDAWGSIERQTNKTGPARAQQGRPPVAAGERRQEMTAHRQNIQDKTHSGQGSALRTQNAGGLPGAGALSNRSAVNAAVFDQIRKIAQQNLQMDFSAYQGVNPLSDPDIDPVFLDMVLIKSWGKEWFSWDPATVRAEYKYVFNIEPSRRLMDKTLAVQTIHVSEAPFTDWSTFVHTAAALTNHDVRFGDLPELSPAEAAYAAVTMQRLRRSGFSGEVITYWAGLCLHENLIVPPMALSQALPIIQKRLNKTHPELLPEMQKIQQFMEKNWAPTGEDNLVDEQLRRLRAMEAFVWTRLAGRPAQQ